MTLDELGIELKTPGNVALITGAGISRDMGVPLGNQILMRFGTSNPSVLEETNLFSKWQQAQETKEHESDFVGSFLERYKTDIRLQRDFVEFLRNEPSIKNMAGAPSDIHAAIAIAWLNRIFTHLVTTNWDFLLEYQIDRLTNLEMGPDEFRSPFDPAQYTFRNGKTTVVEAEQIYSLNPREGDDLFMEARWDIFSSSSDLKRYEDWVRPIWKIHGSPFFLACPKCGGFSRWEWINDLTVGDPCPEHPEQTLKPEIILWGQGLDTVNKEVWELLTAQLKQTDMLIVCGLSGSGSDKYIRDAVETHRNAWVVDPYLGSWNSKKMRHVDATAAAFANLLIEEFLTKA